MDSDQLLAEAKALRAEAAADRAEAALILADAERQLAANQAAAIELARERKAADDAQYKAERMSRRR